MTKDEARAYVIRHCNPDYPKGKTEWERAINMAIKALEQPEQPTWIPCSERLPEKDGYYLVSEDDGNIEVEWYDNTGWGYCGVIAWMPLPPVYQEEDKRSRR